MAEIKLVDADPTSEKSLCFGDLKRGDIFRFSPKTSDDAPWCMKGDKETGSSTTRYMVLRSGVISASFNCNEVELLPKGKSIQITP